jgi:pimeloyl-ACP methyl ester carboxylesterase
VARIVFLPGAAGRRSFWSSIAERLSPQHTAHLVGWPGFGDEPAAPDVTSVSDLVDYVLARVDRPFVLAAQSMGGVVAMLLTLRRPELVQRLVLCGTSGGLDLTRFAAADWRPDYLQDFTERGEAPPSWFIDDRSDLTAEMPSIRQPVLLLWGEDDAISPPEVGRYLAGLLPDARLVTVPGAGHSLAEDRPDDVARHIEAFLAMGVTV